MVLNGIAATMKVPKNNTTNTIGHILSKNILPFRGINDVRQEQIDAVNKKDSFTKTTPSFDFEKCYNEYYNADKINSVINGRIKEICESNEAIPHVEEDIIKHFDKHHIQTTYEYAKTIGKQLKLNDQEMYKLEVAATLHDIGKTLIPDEILNKPFGLNPREREIINTHSELGYEILKGLGANEESLDVALNHHRDNAGGKLCDIVKIADRYSALTSVRPYKGAFTQDESFEILNKEVKDGRLNGEYLQAFKDAIGYIDPKENSEKLDKKRKPSTVE